MINTDPLYKLFGVLPNCSDDELRSAYRHALLEHHPDRNPHEIETATAITQQLTSAYAELKKRRAGQMAEPKSIDGENGIKITIDGQEFTIHFSFGGGVDIKDIANRKATFKNEWEEFRQNPSDPISALRLVHAAFKAEQQDSIRNLLLNPVLVDSASLLLSLVQNTDACVTLIRWSEVLQHSQRPREAIQILEDAIVVGTALPSVADELRKLHYSWAQYTDPTTGNKATPEVRLEHLRRILELGFKYDYIYKMIAEAYHDLGDDEQARECLRHAFELNPGVSGAVRISRVLGFSQSLKPSPSKIISPSKYKYSRPEQIPSSIQIREWTQVGNWDAIIEYADPQDYSPRILSKSREIHRLIASSLADCKSPRAIEALSSLLNSCPYWDVSEAAATSLSKIGDERTLELLEQSKAGNSHEQANLQACISYLRARLSNKHSLVIKADPQELLAQAENAFAKEDYGQARILLENLLANIEQSDSIYIDATLLLARSCAKMNDKRTSVDLIKPLLPTLPEKSRVTVYQDMASWLWSDLLLQQYAPINDDNYRLALEIHLELALMAKTPDDILKNLRSLTRWLELLGAGSSVQWIRQLIRTEAPGTAYVDKDNREQYIRYAILSPYMRDCLSSIETRVKSNATAKLKQVLHSVHTSENAKFLLDDD